MNLLKITTYIDMIINLLKLALEFIKKVGSIFNR